MLTYLNNASLILFSLFFFLYPFFYLPFTFEASELSKLILLIIVSLGILTINSIKLSLTKKFEFSLGKYFFPLALLVILFIISSVINSPNIVLTLISAQSTSAFIFLFLFYLLLTGFSSRLKMLFLDLTVFGGSISSIFVICMYLGIIPKDVIVPTGNLLASSIFFLCLLIYQIPYAFTSFSKKNILTIISVLFIAVAQILLVFHLLSDQKPILLSNSIGFSIFKEIAYHPRSLVLGVGPSNFISAFTIAKPASINQTPLANITFSSSSSFFTNILSEIGLFGGLIFIYIFLSLLFTPTLSLLVLLILLAVFPGSLSLLILFISLLAQISEPESVKKIDISKLKFFIYLFPLISVALFTLIGYLAIRAYLAEYYYYRSFSALNNNDGTLSYNLQKKSISLNPYLDKYHLSLSQTSLLLAESLLKKENPESQDNEKIPKLIEQAIEEGRIAVNLNKTNVTNWNNLTKIYSALINFAPGSEIWAVDIARQTITLDPQNPNNYLTLGQIYLKMNQKEEADKYFNKALLLKSDLNLPANIMPPPKSPDKEQGL